MSFGETLYTKLSGDVGVSALVGTRIYPNKFKQTKTVPAIRYSRVSGVRPSAMGSDVGITRYTYQIDIIGNTYSTTDAAKEAVVTSLRRWRQTGLQDTFIIQEVDDFDDTTNLDRIRLTVEFIVEE